MWSVRESSNPETETPYEDSYEAGFNEGYLRGLRTGNKAGIREGRREVAKWMKGNAKDTHGTGTLLVFYLRLWQTQLNKWGIGEESLEIGG